MKKIIIIIVSLIILPVAWYLISPIFIVIERDDEVPFKEIIDSGALSPPDMLEKIIDNIEEEDNTKDEVEVSNITIPYEGEFVAAEHKVKGNVKLILSGDKAVIRFEDFETINGPDLFIYLGTDLKAKDLIDLGRIKGTKGNINYEVDADIDFDKYKYVMVWCKPFSALFSYAELEKNKLIK